MTAYPNFIVPDSSDPRLQSKSRYRMLIDGRSVDAVSGKTIDRVSPGHAGVVVGTWPDASADDVRTAVAAARRAFDTGPWPRMSGAERSRLMFRTAELILAHVEEIALIESLEVGKPIAQARGEITFCADLWSYAAGQARALEGQTHNNIGDNRLGLVLREPIGVVGIITPWNFPFIIASERVPWAIGGGCTVVLKPSEFTSGTSIRMAELAREAGIPDGVFNVVTGYGDPAGQVLAEEPGTDMIAFTGSTRVGIKLGEIAARSVKRVGLELGGKGPQIVFADADLDAAADGIAYGVYHNAGQCCISGSRLIVQDSIRDALLERLLDISRKVTFGDPLSERTKIGAMISEAHAAKVHSYVETGQASGAELLLGGTRVGDGAGLYYAPTIFGGVTSDMSIARDEIFGPVLATMTFKTADEAVALANASEFGLSASVWSTSLETALQSIRRIRAGRCWINSVIDGTPELPIGGYKKSGLGRELGRYGFDEYSQFKGIHVTLGRPDPWFG
ncbi:aldehyde dehydrogenase family protein [Mesorhizobium sp. BE184]|uniref:aldehyde dehydrogenase family protein n=1 Tax=Mesorhizobium sp. BE184 TaxID=2817714 RepID=UPI002862F784|nr:aldehyde dehydrogenase family protein [Mesorhizobium sp. BE184]MDR7033352.1 acyl-CoA reductase-like NAD-dependent aldehyde dehydrogenase [Mesorhizobium sp. BE184]